MSPPWSFTGKGTLKKESNEGLRSRGGGEMALGDLSGPSLSSPGLREGEAESQKPKDVSSEAERGQDGPLGLRRARLACGQAG